ALAEADVVLTGEGSFDFQSVRGKVAGGVAKAATEHGVPCLVLAGQVSLGRQQAAAAGVEAAYSVTERAGSVEAAMARPGDGLAELAARVAGEWSRR
ncbi:MAG TPA: glycerate kinase, partial [Mycobacteriales bacterium]|nr:glycerate kinase [Mycobacteriales bacterium]